MSERGNKRRKQIKRKMADQYSDIWNSKESEGMNEIGLPIEICCKIFCYLDFATQNCATLVCKLWLEMIRNDFKLSGELALNSIDKMEATEINSIISKWKKLKILRALNNWHPQRNWRFVFPQVETMKILEIEFRLCPTLERVVVPVVANTTTNVSQETFYFDTNAVYDLKEMLPTWAQVSKIWFDPQKKEIQKLGLENVSELCLTLDEEGESVEYLESIGASLVNLDSLCIWIKYVEREEYPEHNIDYCLPLLKNLPSNLHLELDIEDPMIRRPNDLPVNNEHFYSFIKHFALKVSSLNAYISGNSEPDQHLNLDFCWIRYFKNLEKFEMKFLYYEVLDVDDVIEELCQNPLLKLKEFRNPRFIYKSDKFLMRIFEAFPMIETLVIDEHSFYSWKVENLLSVLQSLLSIKNLTFFDHVNLVGSNFSLFETKVIFEAAFDLIKQFPDDSFIKIEEIVYGYKIIKEKEMLPKIYHKNCINDCISQWSYHTVCKILPSRKKKSINTIIDFFLKYEFQLKGGIVNNFNTEITLIKHKDISVEVTENIFAVLLDVINKLPIEICLKVIDDVHGYRILKEEMKEPRIYHRICEKDCAVKFSFHSICTAPEKPKKSKNSALQKVSSHQCGI